MIKAKKEDFLLSRYKNKVTTKRLLHTHLPVYGALLKKKKKTIRKEKI